MNEEEKEQSLIEEGKIAPIKKQIIVGIVPAFKDQLLSYLQAQPYKDVAFLVEGLKQCKPFEVTFNG